MTRSYIERNLYLNWKDPSVKELEGLSRFYMRNETVKTIASTMDGRGAIAGYFQKTLKARLINAPSSTKNEDGKRDPEMHQTKKGQQY
ncbi:hypothetical protein BLL42_00220 [Pseudomonas frederiksbergensis]|uniref:Uncharacterized protein n=1 Tax=Pseudomonas frederiksbergensis TaxID=104087 RepID=A0A1J0EDW0_9PSED|nr:hypothetical protein [Pseudomonas frederiksbergensis]APC14241.1 hypothetical protein BLL42_00220 [Pseudomonas frederiksbergensis]